jgi:hypothetical protein
LHVQHLQLHIFGMMTQVCCLAAWHASPSLPLPSLVPGTLAWPCTTKLQVQVLTSPCT